MAGGFRPPYRLSVGKNPNPVAVGDFNGDLKSDLAVANYTDNNVSVFPERDLFLNLFETLRTLRDKLEHCGVGLV